MSEHVTKNKSDQALKPYFIILDQIPGPRFQKEWVGVSESVYGSAACAIMKSPGGYI